MKKNLLLIHDSTLINESENYILLGNYNNFENKNLKRSNLEFFQDENINNKELEYRYDYCEKIFLKILNKVTIELNKIHKTKYSIKFWEILLGRFLRLFVYSSLHSYMSLNKILKNNTIDNVYLINPNKYKLFVQNTEGLEYAKNNNNWKSALNSKILNKMNISSQKKFVEIENNFFFNKKKKISTKNILVKILSKLFSFFFKKNSIIFYLTYIPFLSEKYVELKLKQAPSLNYFKNIKYKKYNSEIRSNINFDDLEFNDEFEKILLTLLPEALPLFVIENFVDLECSINSSAINQNPKIIFTSVGYAYDEVFKFYVAKNCEKNTKFFVMQHGNNYFTHIQSKYLSELQSSNLFISWGQKNLNKNIVPAFNLKTIRKLKYNKNAKYLTFMANSTIYPNAPYDRDFFNKVLLTNAPSLLSKLKKNIKDNTMIKFHRSILKSEYNKHYYSHFSHYGFKFYNSEEKMRNINKKTRLWLYNYESSGFFENLAMNIPTVLYLDFESDRIIKPYQEIYKLLEENKIIFKNKTDLIKHINDNWESLDDWWFSIKTQNSIKLFNSELNILFKNFNELIKLFKI